MHSNRLKPRVLLWASIALFAVSLTAPIGDGWFGWQAFVATFWVLPQVVWTEPGIFFLALSGAAANVLLLFSWIAIATSRLRRFAPWTAVGAVLLTPVNLFRVPWAELGIGYWLWLLSSIVLLGAALANRRLLQQANLPAASGCHLPNRKLKKDAA